MIQYPMSFVVSSDSSSSIAAEWKSRAHAESGLPVLTLAIPPEFEGPGGGFSPEDLYALALINCFVATFKVFAEKSRLAFTDLKAEGTLTVDRAEGGVPMMKAFLLKVILSGVEDEERALRLLQKTSQSCMILNSVKTEKTFEFSVNQSLA